MTVCLLCVYNALKRQLSSRKSRIVTDQETWIILPSTLTPLALFYVCLIVCYLL